MFGITCSRDKAYLWVEMSTILSGTTYLPISQTHTNADLIRLEWQQFFATVRSAKTKDVKIMTIEERSETKTIKVLENIRRPVAVALAAVSAKKTTLGLLALLLGGGFTALAGNDNRAPEVPEEIAVDATNKVHFHGFAIVVRIYTWTGT